MQDKWDEIELGSVSILIVVQSATPARKLGKPGFCFCLQQAASTGVLMCMHVCMACVSGCSQVSTYMYMHGHCVLPMPAHPVHVYDPCAQMYLYT